MSFYDKVVLAAALLSPGALFMLLQSPMVFGPEWEVKLKEESWLLCCAEPLGKLWFSTCLFTCGTLGSRVFVVEAGEVSP